MTFSSSESYTFPAGVGVRDSLKVGEDITEVMEAVADVTEAVARVTKAVIGVMVTIYIVEIAYPRLRPHPQGNTHSAEFAKACF